MAYDRNNIFARILSGEVPCKKILETEHVLAFHDISPQRPVHMLVIPKGEYESLDDLTAKAPPAAIAALFAAAGQIAREAGLDQTGYRLIVNTGRDGGQEVPHLHLHIVGGASAGPMLKRREA